MAQLGINIYCELDMENLEGTVKVSKNVFSKNCEKLEDELSYHFDEYFFLNLIHEIGIDLFAVSANDADCYDVEDDTIELIRSFITENFEDADDLDIGFRFITDSSCHVYVLILKRETMRNGGWYD